MTARDACEDESSGGGRGGLDRHSVRGMRTVTDPDVAAGYAVDSSLGAAAPGSFEVVRARDRADVVEVLTEAAATRRPVVPQGARTGLAGGAVATEGSLVLNVEGLDQIEELDELERFAVVGPGVVNASLKAAAAAVGARLPAGPRVVGELHARRQRRDQRRRALLRQVRRDGRLRARPRGRPARRSGDAHGTPDGQGRGRVRPHRVVRGLRGAAGRGDVGRRAAGAGAGPAADGARDVRDARGGRRRRRGAAGRTPGTVPHRGARRADHRLGAAARGLRIPRRVRRSGHRPVRPTGRYGRGRAAVCVGARRRRGAGGRGGRRRAGGGRADGRPARRCTRPRSSRARTSPRTSASRSAGWPTSSGRATGSARSTASTSRCPGTAATATCTRASSSRLDDPDSRHRAEAAFDGLVREALGHGRHDHRRARRRARSRPSGFPWSWARPRWPGSGRSRRSSTRWGS